MDLRSLFQKGIFVAWQGNGIVCVNQTWPHCVNQMGKTQSKVLAEQHVMCESALTSHKICYPAHVRLNITGALEWQKEA
jgi:hypothetical protein